MIAVYTGSANLLNLSGTFGALPSAMPALSSYHQIPPATSETAYSLDMEEASLLISGDRRVELPARFRPPEMDAGVESKRAERLPSRSASTAMAGAAALLGAQGCCYKRDEDTGAYGITIIGGVAIGATVSAAVVFAVLVGIRLKAHLAQRKAERKLLDDATSIQADLEGWRKFGTRDQLKAVRKWLLLPSSLNDDVGRALEHVAWEPKTNHRAVAETMLGVSKPSKEGMLLLAMPHFLFHLNYDSKAIVATSAWIRGTRASRAMCVAAIKSMSQDDQDRWIEGHKSPLLLSYLRIRTPEAYQRFMGRLLSTPIAEVDENTAAMVPEFAFLGCVTPHSGPKGGPQRFIDAIDKRLAEEVSDIEKLYSGGCRDLAALATRDASLYEHVRLLMHLSKNVPDQWSGAMLDNLRAAVDLMASVAAEPYPKSVGFYMEKPPYFCVEAINVIRELFKKIPTAEREAMLASNPSLALRLADESGRPKGD